MAAPALSVRCTPEKQNKKKAKQAIFGTWILIEKQVKLNEIVGTARLQNQNSYTNFNIKNPKNDRNKVKQSIFENLYINTR